MKRSTPFFVIFLLALASGLAAQDSIQHQTDFPPEEFQERRAQVFDEVGDNALVLLQGAPNVRGFRVFRQSNEFYYLTGVEVAHAYLLMDGSKGTTRLYLPHRNARRERGEGKKMSVEDAELALELTGVDEVHGIEALPHHLWRYLLRAPFPKLYTMLSPAEGAAQSRDELLIGFADAISDPWDGATSREGDFVGQIKSRYPQFEIADLTPILDDMRIVKSAREIQLIRRASQLAADGIMEAMRSTEPGLYEYQLDAVARFVFLTNGARGEAYRSITATGTNAFFGHYNRNDSELVAGDLILMDYAPDYRYYVSDVTRMWPVSGKFTADQRELYSWILRYYEELMPRIRPGVTSDQILDEAAAAMTKVFEETEFSKPEYSEAARKSLSFRGHLSHPVGLAVHDVGTYRTQPLRPGTVFSIDPMMWVPEERLYIRIEDVGVVTEEGFENFSAYAPTHIEDIEEFMGQRGVLQVRPPFYE